MTGNSEGKGNALCAGNTILTMQRNAQDDLEGISVIFMMQVKPGTVAVVPGLIGRMQAKGPLLPSAQQPPTPLSNGVQICVNFILMIKALQGLQCKVISNRFSSSSPLFFFSFPPSSLFFFPLPSNLQSHVLLLCSTNTEKMPSDAARRC